MKFNNLSLCPSGGGASLVSACRPGLYPVKGGIIWRPVESL